MSEKVQQAIDKLSKISPLVGKIMESVSEADDLDIEMPDLMSGADEQLIEDNAKLKDLILSLSETITSMEDIITDLTEDLEELRDSEDLSLSDKSKKAIDEIVEQTSLSYLVQVYGNKQSMDAISKSARPYLCDRLIDRFESELKGHMVPALWRSIAGTNG